jgi:hypothetical protein
MEPIFDIILDKEKYLPQKNKERNEKKTYRATVHPKKDISHLSRKNFLKLSLSERFSLITNPSVSLEEIYCGGMFRIHFFGNAELEHFLSLSDLLPETVLCISVAGKKGYRTSLGEYFTDSEQRIPIWSGMSVKIENMQQKRVYVQEKENESSNMSLREFLKMPLIDRWKWVTNQEKQKEGISEGNIFSIDFHNQDDIPSHIDLDDIIPETVQSVEVTDTMGKKRKGRRNARNIFLDEKEHRFPIFSEYTIKILKNNAPQTT